MGFCLKLVVSGFTCLSLLVSILASAVLVFLFLPCTPVDQSRYSNNPVDFNVPGMISRHINVNGFNLFVHEAGPATGKLLLFLHGFPDSALLSWVTQIRFFSAQGYHVVAPDMRGFNGSSASCFTDNFECYPATAVGDVVFLIDMFDKHSNRRVHPKGKALVVGHDWGGAVTWSLALNHPEIVEKFVSLTIPNLLAYEEELNAYGPQFFMSWYMFFFWGGQLYHTAEWLVSKNDWCWLENFFNFPPQVPRQAMQEMRAVWNKPGVITSMLSWYRLTIAHAIRNNFRPFYAQHPRGPQIHMPGLVIGTNDRHISHDEFIVSQSKKHAGPLLTYEIWPESGHWVQHDNSDKLTQRLLQFFKYVAVPAQDTSKSS